VKAHTTVIVVDYCASIVNCTRGSAHTGLKGTRDAIGRSFSVAVEALKRDCFLTCFCEVLTGIRTNKQWRKSVRPYVSLSSSVLDSVYLGDPAMVRGS
jgi:hypothetical protein